MPLLWAQPSLLPIRRPVHVDLSERPRQRIRGAVVMSWLDIVADAVVEVGGTEAGDQLALSVDRAATRFLTNGGDGDPNQALKP